MVAVSTLAGYALHPAPDSGVWLPFAGVFLLAGGSTALNQVQERDLDGRMLRTRNRPLPAGRLRPRTALLAALLLIAGGLAALAAAGFPPLLLGVTAVLFYNGIYTPLKRRTAFAVLPGAVCGALPPLIGWTAAGGHPADFRAVLLAGLLFLWQVPHFWLFAEKHREDYRRAGLPLLATSFTPSQVRRLAFSWSLALAAAIAAVSAFALILLPYSRSLTFLCSLLLFALALDIRHRFDTAPACLFPPADRRHGGDSGRGHSEPVDHFLT